MRHCYLGRAATAGLVTSLLACSLLFSPGASAERTPARKPVLRVGPGLVMVDLSQRDKPLYGQGGLSLPVLSGDGEHVAWVYDNDHQNHYGDYGMIWRDLTSGRTLRLSGTYPYGLDMSASGRYVAYSEAAEIEKSGYVKGMAVWLWDTKTGRRSIISRRSPGDRNDDGSTMLVSVSADGEYVAFPSTSKGLLPQGLRTCTPLVSPNCPEDAGYIYLYNRKSRKITPVPPQKIFGTLPELVDPVLSGDGSVVAFNDNSTVDLWYPASGVVRRLTPGLLSCQSDADDLAISADGSTLAFDCFGVSVIRLGGPEGTDTLEWSSASSDEPYDVSIALSADGSVVAFFGENGAAAWGLWPVYRVLLPAGKVEALQAPGAITGLRPDSPHGDGMGDDQVTMSADGTRIATVTCSIEPPKPQSQTCPKRMDVFRWTFPP